MCDQGCIIGQLDQHLVDDVLLVCVLLLLAFVSSADAAPAATHSLPSAPALRPTQIARQPSSSHHQSSKYTTHTFSGHPLLVATFS